jgi:hypothetical protein
MAPFRIKTLRIDPGSSDVPGLWILRRAAGAWLHRGLKISIERRYGENTERFQQLDYGLRRFPLLRQATLRRGNSCLDISVARWDSAVPAQMRDGTLQESGKFL